MFSELGFSTKEIGVASMVLFAVIDIVGSIPIIIKIKKNAGEISPLKASLVAFSIMVAFLFLGESLLGVIGIGTNEFAVAGSFVLFFMALEMVLGVELFKHTTPNGNKKSKVASIVPLAFPLIAGAGTMTSIISLRAEFHQLNIFLAILINMILVYIVLIMTKRIERVLGEGGIAVLEKVFGIILLAIAIKLFSSNAKVLFQ
ncbi:MAG: MarC family protein [Flavobacteriales bacterium]|jgi:multiple antibiotic resistance protein|nr:MarC family protein [Flavobacteriales bacterium]